MHLELRAIQSAKEMPSYIQCYLSSFAEPESPFTQLVAPVSGSDAVAQWDRVRGFADRQWFAHCADPSSHLVQVVDTDAGDRVVAGSKWNVYTTNPFENRDHPRAAAYWWPAGPARRYTEYVLNRLGELRTRRQPHVLCYYTFTHPDYRRCGAGHLMMAWGTAKADELGIESYIEASPMGSRLYTQHGFRITGVEELQPEQDEESDEWRYWRRATEGLRCAILKRPIRGDWGIVAPQPLPAANMITNCWESTTREPR